MFFSPNDHVLTDVLGDQINGVAVVHKILQSLYLEPTKKPEYLEATKRVLVDLKVTTAQAYRRLVEEVGLPIPSFNNPIPVATSGNGSQKKVQHPQPASQHGPHSMFNNQSVSPLNPGSFGNENAPYDTPMTSITASMQALQLQQQLQAQAAAASPGSNVNGMGLNPRQINSAGVPMQNNIYVVQGLIDGFRDIYGVNPTPEQVLGMVQRQQQSNIALPLPGQGYAGRPSPVAPSGVGPGVGLQPPQQQRYSGSRMTSSVQNMPQAGSGMMMDSRFETHASPDMSHGNQMVRTYPILFSVWSQRSGAFQIYGQWPSVHMQSQQRTPQDPNFGNQHRGSYRE